MKEEKKIKKYNKLLLVALLLLISVGYAVLNANVRINGTSKIKNSTWDIHFENVIPTTGSVSIGTGDSAAAITQGDDTEVTYAVTLDKPGDFYEFTVDAVNDGSVDGMVDTVISTYKIGSGETTNITSNNLPAYLSYSATYANEIPISANHYLKAGTTETYKVRVEFKRDIENSELPNANQSILFNFGVNYVQANSNAIDTRANYTKYTMFKGQNGQIGQDVITGVPLYTTAQAAIDVTNKNLPYYLKHTVVNNKITESYVEITLNDTTKQGMVDAICNGNSGCEEADGGPIRSLPNGTYVLRGGVDERNLATKPIYEANKAVIRKIFGENCANESSPGTSNASLHCNAAFFYAEANASGNVYSSSASGYCYVNPGGGSNCSWS